MTILQSLGKVKHDKIVELEVAYQAHLANDFSSNALGSTKWYTSDLEAQVNLIGAVVAGVDLTYRCGDSQGGAKTSTAHTAAQLQQVFSDGVTFKHNAITNLETKTAAVDAATTEAAVQAITW